MVVSSEREERKGKEKDTVHYLPAAQSLSFQNDELFPFSLHCFHTLRPFLVHHHHFDPLAGFVRLPHLCFFQYLESLPLALHFFHVLRPALDQNHHLALYFSTDPPPPLLDELLPLLLDLLVLHFLYFLRNFLLTNKGSGRSPTPAR
jgi:hypothetical protein